MLIWRNTAGPGAGAGAAELTSAGVPEPSAAFLVLCGGLFVAAHRGRRAGVGRRKSA